MTPPRPPGGPPKGPRDETPKKRCPARTKAGGACITPLRPGETFCYAHDPAREAERKRDAARRPKPGDVGTELGTLDGIARRAAFVLEELDKQRKQKNADGETEVVFTLQPARASAKLNALRFLAALVIKRTEGKAGVPVGEMPREDTPALGDLLS